MPLESVDLEPIVYDDLAPTYVEVSLAKKNYVLMEASGDTAAKYKSKSARCYRLSQEGNLAGIEGIGELEPFLVSLCLAYASVEDSKKPMMDKGGNPVLVPMSTITKWPAYIQKNLYDRIRKISPSLVEKETAETLTKRIKADTERLKALEQGKDSPEDREEKN